jgi:small subunit ribosomal protein S8
MGVTDPIADYLTRIRNAMQARHKKVDVPASRLKRDLTKILLQHKYISNFTEVQDDKQGILRIYLKYNEGRGVINGIERVSTPGRRVYSDSEKLPRVLSGLGIAVISTSRGVMTDKEARRQHVGGEVVCRIW